MLHVSLTAYVSRHYVAEMASNNNLIPIPIFYRIRVILRVICQTFETFGRHHSDYC